MSDHAEYVKAILVGMWGRDTNLARNEGMFAAKLSKQIRKGDLPLPDGTNPTPEQARQIVAHIRGKNRPFTLAKIGDYWQRHVEDLYGTGHTASRVDALTAALIRENQ